MREARRAGTQVANSANKIKMDVAPKQVTRSL